MIKTKNLALGRSGIILSASFNKSNHMLLTIGLILVGLWLIGFVGFHIIGWFIHVLLVVAIVVILLRIIRGKRLI